MKFIFIGDVVGRPGREAVTKILPDLKEKYKPDLVIANCENSCHGRGASEDTIAEMRRAGVNFFTSGNHIYGHKAVIPKLDDKKFPVIRPANFPPGNPGRGFQVVDAGRMQKVLVVNLMGRVFMKQNYDCPFRTMDAILKQHDGDQIDAIIVDIHADATSEKIALCHYLDGRVSAVIGTHTHVPTADCGSFPKGTGFICDVGMVGVKDSVIGAAKESILKSFVTQMPFRYEIPDGDVTFNAVYFETDDSTMQTTEMQQILEVAD